MAKRASQAAEPTVAAGRPRPGIGVLEVADGEVTTFLHPKPVRSLWGVGPATLARLERLGVATIADLAALDADVVRRALGDAAGGHLHALANGIDDRGVEPDRPVRSVSHEQTYAEDLVAAADLDREALRLADGVASRLRAADQTGRTVSVKVRFSDFRTITRSTTLADPVDGAGEIAAAARALLARIDPGPGVRLLGVAVTGLAVGGGRQLRFDLDLDGGREPSSGSRSGADDAVEAIRGRFGDAAIGPATLLADDGLALRRRGAAQWGPGRADGVDEPERGSGNR